MAKSKAKEEVEEKGQFGDESKKVISNLFKANKTDHYNFEEEIHYRVPSSSMILNSHLKGGISPGVSRFTGATSGGKSSSALDFMKNFLKVSSDKELRKGIYFRCEGRLSPEMKERCGVKFVTDADLWENGTCLIVDSNVFEFVFDSMRQLIVQNEEKCKYFFLVDSVDMMAKRADLEKSLEEAATVAGGALITSVFLKKVSTALTKRGHIAIFISQVRETVNINPYAKTPPKQGGASGGHAIEHAAQTVLEFLPRFNDDIIRENDEKNGKPRGHYAKCKIIKDNDEGYLTEVRYPVAYGRKNGNSVWREKEVLDMLQMFNLVTRAGAWYYLDESIKKELETANLPIEEKFQGIGGVNAWLEANPVVVDHFAVKFTI
jgi:RecA/RadA recombinase